MTARLQFGNLTETIDIQRVCSARRRLCRVESPLDLNALLVKHLTAIFLGRCFDDSMTGAGIFQGDILVVDRSEEPRDGMVVVAAVGGEFTVKRLALRNGEAWLMPENPAYKPIKAGEGIELAVWGVVTSSIRFHGSGQGK